MDATLPNPTAPAATPNPATDETPRRANASVMGACLWMASLAATAAGLVWMRELRMIVGSAPSVSLAFLGAWLLGMSAGARLQGRRASRPAHQAARFAGGVIALGIWTLLQPGLVPSLGDLIEKTMGAGWPTPLINLGAAGLFALIPSILCGLAAAAFLGQLGGRSGRHTSTAWPSSGLTRAASLLALTSSSAASLAAVFVNVSLLASQGLDMIHLASGALLLVAGAIAFLSASRASALTTAAPPSDAEQTAGPDSAGTAGGLLSAMAGFIFAATLTAGHRALTLSLGAASMTGSMILTAICLAAAFGAAFARRNAHRPGLPAKSSFVSGLATLGTIILLAQAPGWAAALESLWVRDNETYALVIAGNLLLALATLGLPAMAGAMTLAAATGRSTRARLPAQSGAALAPLFLGAAGGLVAGFFVLNPMLGLTESLALMAMLSFGLAALAHFTTSDAPLARRLFAAAALAVPALAAPPLVLAIEKSGSKEIHAPFLRADGTQRILHHRPGAPGGAVTVAETETSGGPSRILIRDNQAEPAADTLAMLGHLPLLLHGADTVLALGFGSGVTAGAVSLYHPDRISVIERNAAVIDAAGFFEDKNHAVARNMKMDLRIGDPRARLLADSALYDVIINEPRAPHLPGGASLLNEDFYALAKTRLNPAGLFVQLIRVKGLPDDAAIAILNSFNEIFPFSTLFALNAEEVVLLGRATPFGASTSEMAALVAERASAPEIAADLARRGWPGAAAILARQMVAKTMSGRAFAEAETFNTEMFPTLERRADVGAHTREVGRIWEALDRRGMAPGRTGLWIEAIQPGQDPASVPDDAGFAAFEETLIREGDLFPRAALAWTRLWERAWPDSVKARLARSRVPWPHFRARIEILERPDLAESGQALDLRARLRWEQYLFERSWALAPDPAPVRAAFESLAARLPRERPRAEITLGDLALDAGEPDQALRHYQAALAAVEALDPPAAPAISSYDLLTRMAEALLDLGRLEDAAKALDAILPADLAGPGVDRLARAINLSRLRQRLDSPRLPAP